MEIRNNETMGEINPVEIMGKDEIVIDKCLFYWVISPDELERLEIEARIRAKKLQEKWKRHDQFVTICQLLIFSLLGGLVFLILVYKFLCGFGLITSIRCVGL